MSRDTQKLSVLLETYLNKRQRLKWSTIQWTRQAWKRFIEAIGDLDIESLCYADIEDFESYLFGVGLAASSVKSYLKAVHPILDWAVRREYRSDNPMRNYKLPRVADSEIHLYSHDQVTALIAAAEDPRWRALLATAITTGLRKSEALNLRIDDVDFEAQTITVQSHKETNNTWAWTPKSYQRRILPLTEPVSTLYCGIVTELPSGQPYLHLTEKRYGTLRQRLQAGDLTDRQRLWPDENFSNAFRRIRRRAGLERGTYHDLRRTCLTHWSHHLPPQELQKLAGHADIETTMRYYLGVRADVLQHAQQIAIGATGLEPATS